MKSIKNQTWIYNHDIDLEACGDGIARKILAYSEDLMCVENHFETGDSMLQMNDIVHGCKCLEKGIILDIFTPMRKDFVEQRG